MHFKTFDRLGFDIKMKLKFDFSDQFNTFLVQPTDL